MSDEIRLSGNWFNAINARATPAVLVAHDTSQRGVTILLQGDESDNEFGAQIVSISDRVGTIDRRIEFADGSVFVTGDNEGADALRPLRSGVFSRVSGLEAFRPRLLVFFIAAIALLASSVYWGLPVAAKFATWATPPQVAVWMDSSTRATLDRVVLGESKLDDSIKSKLTENFAELVETSGHEANFELLFRDGRRLGANALALPGGTIIITDQLAELATVNEATAVLAHEIAHVEEGHSLQQLYRALGFAGIISVVTGDLGTVAEEVLSGGGVLIAMAASREMELEADSGAVELLRKAGRDPRDLVSALAKLYESVCKPSTRECEETGWLASHPGGKERRTALEQKIDNP